VLLLILQPNPDSQKEEEEDDDEKTLPKDRKMPSLFLFGLSLSY
jgi:hypothetical protein